MTNDNNDQAAPDAAALELHDRQTKAIMAAAAEMLPTFLPRGFTVEAIFEGLIKGAAVVAMKGRGSTVFDIADMLDDFAAGFRHVPDPKRGNLHVVE